MDIRDWKNKLLKEDIGDFQIGKTTTTDTGKTTITDIDPETQSVTWKVNKDLTDDDIHRDLSKLIDKLESNQKRYHDQKRIKQLLQKLKFIRNTFKRTSIEEIKINRPNSLDVYIESDYEDQPYIKLEDGTPFFGYLGDNDFIEWNNTGEEFDELKNYLDTKNIKYSLSDDEEYIMVDKQNLNIIK